MQSPNRSKGKITTMANRKTGIAVSFSRTFVFGLCNLKRECSEIEYQPLIM